MFSVTEKNFSNTAWFADPIVLGRYPEDGIKLFGADMPYFPESDMKIICQPLDFYGTNIYQGKTVRAGIEPYIETEMSVRTTMGWPITPKAMYWGPKFLYERYKLPIVITESGIANMDWVQLDGKVHDPQRIDYLARHFSEFSRALDDGVKGMAYFVWSIMDNFEWAEGYGQRFGLIYVDYTTGERTLKDSALWYKKYIETGGEIPG
jgi:beta-glucosidase